ncbi:MAG: efflux RND transporter permease subunit, partial [Bdellovibrionales bacterium]|nr:efflux RND transporter permease subunit [Bdellovibrionales bacterium]
MTKQNSDIRFSGPLAWMAQNAVAANLLMIVFLVGGLIFATQVKQEVFPEFSTDIIKVTIPYPGASPEEVEQGTILSVEDAVRGLEGVKRVTSVANEGMGTVVIDLLRSANTSKALQDVKNEVDGISSFPEDAERPIVSLVESRRQVVSLLIYGDQKPLALRELAERVRDDLVRRQGVTLVDITLAPQPLIAIEVPEEKLRSFGVTLEQIADKIRSSALELPAGTVRTSAGQVLLRTTERRDYAREFGDIPITTSPSGSVVRVADIADIREAYEESDEEASYEGHPAVRLQVFRVGDETPQSVSKAVSEYISELQPELPEDVGVKIWEDQSLIFQDRLGLLVKNAVLGLVLVLLLLALFLEVHLALWVTLGIPVSIMGCFLFLPLTDASINMISLFAFIVTLGIIVDDAIVVGENIYEKREQNIPAPQAAILGVREIAMPVTFAVLTNIVAFMPLFFVPGISGKFFRQIPAVVVGVFLVSLVESLLILPAHLAHQPRASKIWQYLNRPRERCDRWLKQYIDRSFLPQIRKIIQYRYLTLAVALAALLISAGTVIGGHLRFTFMPKIDADTITAQATLPYGTPLSESEHVQSLLVASAKQALQQSGGAQISKGIYAQIGKGLVGFGPGPKQQAIGGSHLVAVQVTLVDPKLRNVSGGDFARVWRTATPQIPGLESLIFKADTGASEGAAIGFNLTHRSREVLEQAAAELQEILRGYAGVSDIDDGISTGKRQLSFKITQTAESLGLTTVQLARQVRAAFYGAEALRQQRGRNEIKIMVRLPASERSTMSTVENLVIRTPNGGELPLAEAAEIESGRSYTEIQRLNGSRVIAVTADVDEQVSNANQIMNAVIARDLPQLIT